MLRAYKAKWIATADEILENHLLVVDDGHIIDIITEDETSNYELVKIKDFGNALITPGFINMLAHLQYSKINDNKPFSIKNKIKLFFKTLQLKYDFAGMPQNSYVRKIADLQRKYSCADRKQKIESFKFGLEQAILSGTTCISQISKENKFFEIINQVPIKTYLFFEVFADSLQAGKEEFKKIRKKIENLVLNKAENTYIGVAPSSLSNVHKKLWKILSKYCRKNNLLMLIHFAESKEEMDWLKYGFSDIDIFHKYMGLRKLSPYQKGLSPVEYLEGLNVFSKKVLLANACQLKEYELNELEDKNPEFIYCPRYSDKLFNKRPPLKLLKEIFKENLGFGTVGLHFNDDFSLLNEVKYCNSEGVLDFNEIIRHLTIYPAKMLKINNITGSLEKNKDADFNVFELNDNEDYTAILEGKNPQHVYLKGRKVVRNYKLVIKI